MENEADAQDETWCLFDGELVDDELFAALGAFALGFASSCSPIAATAVA